jgi:type IV pilus assembly protein PilN
MIRVNLLPIRELQAAVSRRRDLTIGGLTLGLTALILAGVYFYQSYRMSNLGNELAGLRKEIERLNVSVKELGDLQFKIKDFESKYKVIKDLNQKKIGPVKVMEHLSAATPATLWLTEFKETNGSLDIKGVAVDNQTIADFLSALARSSHFRDVELVETTQTDEKTGPYKKFAIKTRVSYQAPTVTRDATSGTGVSSREGKKD